MTERILAGVGLGFVLAIVGGYLWALGWAAEHPLTRRK